jgi:hypothetical protein
MIYQYNSFIISNLLRRPVQVASPFGYHHSLQLHEGINRLIIDLFADPSLSAKEKGELENGFGRYLYASLQEIGPTTGRQQAHLPLKYEMKLKFLRENFDNGRLPANCEKPESEN